MNDEDEKLDRLLRAWRCPVQQEPRLGAAVWQRIADREEWAAASGDATGWSPAWFGRPWATAALAASLGMAAILGGIGAAELRMQNEREFSASVQNQQTAYFESINPVALARHEHR